MMHVFLFRLKKQQNEAQRPTRKNKLARETLTKVHYVLKILERSVLEA